MATAAATLTGDRAAVHRAWALGGAGSIIGQWGKRPSAGWSLASPCTWPTRCCAAAAGARSCAPRPVATAHRAAATRSPPGSPARARAGSSPRAAATPCACCCCAAGCRRPAARCSPARSSPRRAGECATGALLIAIALVVGVGPQLGASTATVAFAGRCAGARRGRCSPSPAARRACAGSPPASAAAARRCARPAPTRAACSRGSSPAAPAGSARSRASSPRSASRPRRPRCCWSRSRRAGAGCCRSLPRRSAPASRCWRRASGRSPAARSQPSGWPRSTSARARC